MIAALALALAVWSALCILAGALAYHARTRRTVARLDAHVDELLGHLAAVSPDAIEYRAQLVADNERHIHATRARLDHFHLLGGAA